MQNTIDKLYIVCYNFQCQGNGESLLPFKVCSVCSRAISRFVFFIPGDTACDFLVRLLCNVFTFFFFFSFFPAGNGKDEPGALPPALFCYEVRLFVCLSEVVLPRPAAESLDPAILGFRYRGYNVPSLRDTEYRIPFPATPKKVRVFFDKYCIVAEKQNRFLRRYTIYSPNILRLRAVPYSATRSHTNAAYSADVAIRHSLPIIFLPAYHNTSVPSYQYATAFTGEPYFIPIENQK